MSKTVTTSVGEQLDVYVAGHKLERVDLFKYLGSYVSTDSKLDEETQAASCAMWKPGTRFF